MRTIGSTARLAYRKTPIASVRQKASQASVVFTLVVGVAAALASVSQASAEPAEPTIEGVWHVTRHGVDCQTAAVRSTFPAIMAFIKDGIVTGSAVPPGSSPALGSAEYGVWHREPGSGRYECHIVGNNYDASGTFRGMTEVTGHVTLADHGSSFSYSASIKFLDTAGGLQFAMCGAATATRFE